MDKERYNELVELYERLEAAEKLFYLRYGDLRKVDGKFYWNRLIDTRWIRDEYRWRISRKVPCHWNWSELKPIDCARLFIQGDLPSYYSPSNDNDYDSFGRKIFGDEVWNEASRLYNEDEDGVNYVEWKNLKESTPLIFPEPDPIPCVEDLNDWKTEWSLPDEDDFVAYLKGEKKLEDFQTMVYCPMLGSIGLERNFEAVVWRVFPVIKGKEWQYYVNSMIDALICYTECEEKEEGDVLDGLEAVNFNQWTLEQREEILKRYHETDLKLEDLCCVGEDDADDTWDLIDFAVPGSTSERYW